MSVQSEISYLQKRVAAAGAAANAATDGGVKAIHLQFAAAYEQRISAILENERMVVTVSEGAVFGRSAPIRTVRSLGDRKSHSTLKTVGRLGSVQEALSSTYRMATDGCPS